MDAAYGLERTPTMTCLYREAASAQPEDVPDALGDALRAHGATACHWWREGARTYLELDAGGRGIFARYSTDPRDVAVLAHEVDARRAVAGEAAFRVPPVLASGPGWLVEHRVPAGEPWGTERAAATARAGVALAAAPVPVMAGPGARPGVVRRLVRLARTARSPLSLSDYSAAKRLLAGSSLPTVTGHGDFHAGNTLFADEAVWLIDWELAGPQPQGWDLAQLWASLADPAQRAAVVEVAVSWVGERRRRQFAELQYVALVRAVAAKVAPDRSFDREEAEAEALLGLLPTVRREAGVSVGRARRR